MRIAMIGQRGIPAAAGGVERAVEELGAELAGRGHEVVVFARNGYASCPGRAWRGMEVRSLPTVHSKHLEALVHTGLCTASILPSSFDIVHFHALGPGLFAPLPRVLTHAAVVQTVHGLDHAREKWHGGAQRALRIGDWMSARVPDATIVVSEELRDYYADRWSRTTYHIPNGVRLSHDAAPSTGHTEPTLRSVRPGFLLFVGRLTPEKGADVLIRAFRQVQTRRQLVIVGGSSHTDQYVRHLRELAQGDPRIVFPGYIYGEALSQLYRSCSLFVLPSLLEGMPLVLLEAAAFGVPVIASDIGPHREVIGRTGPGRRLTPAGDDAGLAAAIGDALDNLALERASRRLQRRVLAKYRWPKAAEETERVYESALRRRERR